jgi:hypothetical protein
MERTLLILSLLATTSSGATTPSAATLDLPEPLRAYRSWPVVLPSTPVPYELWIGCDTVSPEELESERKKHGPHAVQQIRVYANAVAAAALLRGEKTLPIGSALAKEKLDGTERKEVPVGVAFMTKRRAARGGRDTFWEFAYFPRPFTDFSSTKDVERREARSCAACHQAAPNDGVFGDYRPRPSKPAPSPSPSTPPRTSLR